MLQIHRTFSVAKPQPFGVAFGCSAAPPMAGVNLNFSNDAVPTIEIFLRGEIIGPSVELLRDFLREIYKLSGRKWTLEMSEVDVISFRALRHLIGFARRLRKRGLALHVAAMHPAVLASVYDLKLAWAFDWEEQTSAPTVAEVRENAPGYWDQKEMKSVALAVAA